MTRRIAMWSGPRNISTALMRSWENRSDCFVTDEPLYAYYLRETGLDHPGRAETLAAHDSDWQSVTEWLSGPVPEGKSIWYQKHMAHHLLPEVDRNWLNSCINCFLIRNPREMITSLIQFIPEPRVEDTGLSQQIEIFERVSQESGQSPPVIDGKDVLENPHGMLRALCERLGVEFTDDMLQWPSGLRETDGAWAPYWYETVKETTQFATYRPKPDPVPDHLEEVARKCEEHYAELSKFKITPQAETVD